MIEPMKKVFLIVPASAKGDMLRSLRRLGILHITEEKVPKSEKGEALAKLGEEYDRLAMLLSEYADRKRPVAQKSLRGEEFTAWFSEMRASRARRKALRDRLIHDEREVTRISPWGDFDPDEVRALEGEGISLSFYLMGEKEVRALPGEVKYLALAPVEGQSAIAVYEGSVESGTKFILPEHSLSFYREEEERVKKELAAIEDFFRSSVCYLDALRLEKQRNAQDIVYRRVFDGMEGDDELCHLKGYLPSAREEKFAREAKVHEWGYSIEDPGEEDNPPTLLTLKGGLDMMKPIYGLLGIVPGYRERDISFWFLLFFTLFFAMIIGDAGYGLIFLALGLFLHKRSREASAMVRLLYTLSCATIVWGALTGTWFGSARILSHAPFLRKLVIAKMANIPEMFNVSGKVTQDTMMNLCFLIGTIQLSLACLLNIVSKVRKGNLSFLADIGWLVDILALYKVIIMLIFGAEINLPLAFASVGVGFALVLIFGNQAPGKPFLKGVAEGLGGILPTFLNTVSCFSNTMSYIRLFAVGMAGFAIASSFNSMAESVASVKVIGILGFLFVVLVGHALNLVMGLLSVIVHGVRLNILEFSNQLGMEWSGYPYEPFHETVKDASLFGNN